MNTDDLIVGRAAPRPALVLTDLLGVDVIRAEAQEVEQIAYGKIETTIDSSRDCQLHASIFLPQGTDEKLPLVLFAHGFEGSRKGLPTRENEPWLFEKMGRELAQKGIASISVDFPGCRESEEASTFYTLSNMLSDLQTSFDYMVKNHGADPENVGIIAHSMGCRVASLYLNENIRAAALWTPAAAVGLKGLEDFMGGEEAVSDFYMTARREGLARFQLLDKPHTELSLQFFEENEAANPIQAIADYEGNLFVAVGLDDTAIPKDTTDAVIAAATNVHELEVLSLDHASHIFLNTEDPTDFSMQDLVVERTVDFISQKLGR